MLEQQEFLPEYALIHERWSGIATVEEVQVALRGHLESPHFADVRAILSDERAVEDFAFSSDEIREFASSAWETIEAYEDKRWAFVVDRARTTALVMVFQALLESRLDVQVFSTLEKACSWLGLSAAATEHVLSQDNGRSV